jgi:Protein of unknown function (DUF2924)
MKRAILWFPEDVSYGEKTWRLRGDWKANENDEIPTNYRRAPLIAKFPLRTTRCMQRIEQCLVSSSNRIEAQERSSHEFWNEGEGSEVHRAVMKRRDSATGGAALDAEIASLSELGIDEVRECWKAICGKAPSREIGRSFLTRAIAYYLQERMFDGLKPSTCRLLARNVEEGAPRTLSNRPSRMAQTGTILIREWQGTIH